MNNIINSNRGLGGRKGKRIDGGNREDKDIISNGLKSRSQLVDSRILLGQQLFELISLFLDLGVEEGQGTLGVLGYLVLITLITAEFTEMLLPNEHLLVIHWMFQVEHISLLGFTVIRVGVEFIVLLSEILPDGEGSKENSVLDLLLIAVAQEVPESIRV